MSTQPKPKKLKYELASTRPRSQPMNEKIRDVFESYASELTAAGVEKITVADMNRAPPPSTNQEFYVSTANTTAEQRADITIALQHVAAKLTDVTGHGFYVDSGRSMARGSYTSVRPRTVLQTPVKSQNTSTPAAP